MEKELQKPCPASKLRSLAGIPIDPSIPMAAQVASRKSSAPGSEAAWDKWLLQNSRISEKKSSAPGSEAARDKWLPQKESDF